MSSMSPSDEGPEDDGLTHCADYVDSQSSDMDVKIEVCSPSEERIQAPVYEEHCDSTDVSDDSASVVPPACVKKRKAMAIKLKEERLDLQCEWRDCDYRTGNLDHFVRHVSLHIPDLEVKMTGEQEGSGSVVFPRILPAFSSTWHCNLYNICFAHINFRSLLKHFRSNRISFSRLHAKSQFDCITIVTTKQMGSILIT
jgi:hypothetical protein